MKKLTFITLVTVAMALCARAGDKDLPPGIAKKRGTVEEEHTRFVTNTVVVPAVPVPPAPVPPAAPVPAAKTPAAPTLRQLRVDIDKRARAINTLDNKVATRRTGLEAIAKETGVSVPTLQAQHRQHQEVGTAGLLMANVIAVQTKRPAGNYLRQAAEGKPWERIAADGGVNLEDLDAKLARLEEAMRNTK